MRAGAGDIAAQYDEPVDLGNPMLPEWTVLRRGFGGIVLVDPDNADAFIPTERPATVQR